MLVLGIKITFLVVVSTTICKTAAFKKLLWQLLIYFSNLIISEDTTLKSASIRNRIIGQ